MSFRESLPWKFIICLTIAACSDSSGPDLRQSLSLQVVSGNAQIDTVARTLPDPIVVRIEDAAERAVQGQIVNFVVTAGGGSVFAGSAITDDQGRAQEIWTLGTTAGEQELEARAVDAATGEPIVFAKITATAVPGAATTLSVDPDTLALFVHDTVSMDSIAITAADQYGNAIDRSRAVLSGSADLGWDQSKLWGVDAAATEVHALMDQMSVTIPVYVFDDFIQFGHKWEYTIAHRWDPPLEVRAHVFADSSIQVFESDSLAVLGYYQNSLYGAVMEYDVWWTSRIERRYLTTGEVEVTDWGAGNPPGSGNPGTGQQNIAHRYDDMLVSPGNDLLARVSDNPLTYGSESVFPGYGTVQTHFQKLP